MTLEQEIHQITQIPIGALRGQSLANFGVEQRINWATTRTKKWKEDKVYCLLGVFEVFLPLIYGEGEANATRRLQEEIKKRQKGQGTESLREIGVPPSLPFPRNELYVGREDQLRWLDQHLRISDAYPRVTICGLGGCGKSALAIEFAYRVLAANATHMVFWVPAISHESFERAYREIGAAFCIPEITDENANIKQLVKEALSMDSRRDWLMIVDNTDDPSVLLRRLNCDLGDVRLHDYLPRSTRGKILFTTRSRKMAGELTPGAILDLHDMSRAEARQLLARRITNPALLNDGKAVDELLSLLEYLPLAIVQAAAFMDTNDVSVSKYVSLLQQEDIAADLFGQHFEDANRYRDIESTVAKTWHISFEQLRRQDPLAAEYLSFVACIDRIGIAQSLLPLDGSVVQRVKAIGTLKGYAFITER
ncbi:uncharacterized protein HMPREF1541_10956 [Cyphellophora europaea CBS 101466]|uniref:NB-ARC domain-containing protein n=1 Tax=Cyphellophora europaea (strain CBS 101466) TaxID=1220924 RepID=W2S5V0_CYPE1|nr:uncharacterized protein HMPREF1541_10956 [Cyphellophora europaea CBS 101466]ETN44091.1 hypothetical protein HMPREF1541_10956 [Cyphellophora europaea CBS 101466]